MSGFSKMLQFQKELIPNNNREWFQERKAAYEEIRKECCNEIDKIISQVALFDNRLRGVTCKDCIYRIYRDVRFSHDKSPYKTWFGVVLGSNGKKTREAAYYIHLYPGDCGVFAGVWYPENDVLKALRSDIDGGIEEFLEILNNPEFKLSYPELVGESLKTIPKGYPKDYPYPEIIKMKEYLVRKPLSDDFFDTPDWIDEVVSSIKLAKPFVDFLNYTFEDLHK